MNQILREQISKLARKKQTAVTLSDLYKYSRANTDQQRIYNARFLQLYPHVAECAGYDRTGRPLRVECVGRIDTKALYEFTDEEFIMRYHMWQAEVFQLRYMPAAEEQLGREVNSLTCVLDLRYAALERFDGQARDHIRNFINMLADFYPETMHTMLIVNAPDVFSVAWDIIKPLLDKRTQSKISILSAKESQDALLEIIHPMQLPTFLGGLRETSLDGALAVVDKDKK